MSIIAHRCGIMNFPAAAGGSATLTYVSEQNVDPGFINTDPANQNRNVDLGATSSNRTLLMLTKLGSTNTGLWYNFTFDPSGENEAMGQIYGYNDLESLLVKSFETAKTSTQEIRWSWNGTISPNPNPSPTIICEFDGVYTLTPGTPVTFTSGFGSPNVTLSNCNLASGEVGLFMFVINDDQTGGTPSISRGDSEAISILRRYSPAAGDTLLVAATYVAGTNFSISLTWDVPTSSIRDAVFIPLALS